MRANLCDVCMAERGVPAMAHYSKRMSDGIVTFKLHYCTDDKAVVSGIQYEAADVLAERAVRRANQLIRPDAPKAVR